jgi:3-hydroxyacyl-[acyl-carrier-protein] dehydratase
MLSGYFFEIQSYTIDLPEEGPSSVQATVTLNAQHPVFSGHFPGNPVVPGVCQVQMIKELVEKAVKMPLKLRESDNIKFLAMISPETTPQVEIAIQIKHMPEKVISATATISSGGTVFLKFKGKFESEADA